MNKVILNVCSYDEQNQADRSCPIARHYEWYPVDELEYGGGEGVY